MAHLDFPNSPTTNQKYTPNVGGPTYTWDGEKWTTVAGSMGGKTAVYTDDSTPMTAQLTLITPPVSTADAASKAYVDTRDTLAMQRNYIINGAMMISQQNGATASTANLYYPCDQFSIAFANTATQTTQQVASRTPGGSPNRIRVTATVADASVAAGDYCQVVQVIEGFRVAGLGFGTASAKTVTLQFGIRAPAGTYGISLMSPYTPRAYVAECVVAAGEANIDVVKNIVFPGDVTGSWPIDNNGTMYVSWCLMGGTSFQQAGGSWLNFTRMTTSNQFNFMGTVGNVFELFDVSLTEGSVAPPFQVPDMISELVLCQRYWRKISSGMGICFNSTSVRMEISHSNMRVAPTATMGGTANLTDVYAANATQSSANVTTASASSEAGQYDLGNFTGLTVGRVYVFLPATFPLLLNARP